MSPGLGQYHAPGASDCQRYSGRGLSCPAWRGGGDDLEQALERSWPDEEELWPESFCEGE
ncbi:MAG: hypothetical protein WB392_11750 [Methanotrichaceae archaeon]